MRLTMAAALAALLVVFVPGSRAADQQITAQPNSAQFTPNDVTVNVGEKVTVTHSSGSLQHNIHYDDQIDPCPGPPTTSTWTCERTFNVASNYTFHCDFHASMTGTVHVVAPTTTTPGPGPTPTTPTTPTSPATVTTPKTVPLKQIARVPKGCAPRRSFRIRLRHPTDLSAARIFVNGKRVAAPKGEKLASRIKVRGLPRGRFTLKVQVTRIDGSRLVGKRRLRTCS